MSHTPSAPRQPLMMRLQVSSDSTVEFYTLRGPVAAPPRLQTRFNSEELTPVLDPIAKLTRECSALRLKLATAERRERNSNSLPPPSGYRTAPASARTPPHTSLSLTLDNVLAQRDAARTHVQSELMKLAERYKALERTLRDMQDVLRMKDREIEMLRAERDRAIAERDEIRAKSRSVSRERSQVGAEDDMGNGKHQRHRNRSRSRRHARRSDELTRRSVDDPLGQTVCACTQPGRLPDQGWQQVRGATHLGGPYLDFLSPPFPIPLSRATSEIPRMRIPADFEQPQQQPARVRYAFCGDTELQHSAGL